VIGIVVGALLVVGLPALAIGYAVVKARAEDRKAPAGSVRVSIFDLQPGNCFQLRDANEEEVENVRVVECSAPHPHEVFAVYDLPAGPWPGDGAVDTAAGDGCEERFTAYVGTTYGDSTLEFDYYTPTEATWRDDRSVICAVTTDPQQTGSVRGSRR
jgi:hypothetical protein